MQNCMRKIIHTNYSYNVDVNECAKYKQQTAYAVGVPIGVMVACQSADRVADCSNHSSTGEILR